MKKRSRRDWIWFCSLPKTQRHTAQVSMFHLHRAVCQLLRSRPAPGALHGLQGVLQRVTLAVSMRARSWGTPPEARSSQLPLLVGQHKTFFCLLEWSSLHRITELPRLEKAISFHPKLLRTARCLLYQDWSCCGGVGNGKNTPAMQNPQLSFTYKALWEQFL